jgi:hypothetical protein
MKLDELVKAYIEVRDKKAEIKAQYEAKAAKADAVLDKIEAKLLQTFDEIGMDSCKTEFGTAYTSHRSTSSVADKEVFMNFVKDNEEWPLLEVRAAKSGVEQYKEAHGDLPPGVNYRVERTINIRRS